jgi:poly-gamma-glutamate synthesis protein (capsule biosynthesis protein)
MLGRGVGEVLAGGAPPGSLVAPELAEMIRSCDIVVLNLECCISEGGRRWPDPRKPFFFRAPPVAVEVLVGLGVDCVTLANNHALDYGREALADTLAHLGAAGIGVVGAGADLEAARRPWLIDHNGFRLGVIGFTDHPADYAAGPDVSGVAHVDLARGTLPGWLGEAVGSTGADAVLVTPHWGPNMTTAPVPQVLKAATALVEAGATLVAGHSAHLFHGVRPPVIYDLGDFLDDYAVDPVLRNDLGLVFLVELASEGVTAIEAVPIRLEYARTRLAVGEETAWIERRLRAACAEYATDVDSRDGKLIISI